MTVIAQDFRDVLSRFASGVTIVTTVYQGRPCGLTASSFSSVSLDPPLVLFCLGKDSTNFDAFMAAESFAFNILSSDQDTLSTRFARKDIERFEGVAFDTWVTGSPVLPGALAALDCTRHAVHDAGDHVIVIGRVQKLGVLAPDAQPLTYWRGRYRSLAS